MSATIEIATENQVRGHFHVNVTYNGVDKKIEPKNQNETVRALLAQSIQAFGPLPNPHLLALFNKEGQELKDDDTLKQAGVENGDHLLLRPSAVRGG